MREERTVSYDTEKSTLCLPASLKKGDRVCLIDPANAFTDEAVKAAATELKKAGFIVEQSSDMAFKRGSAKERAKRFNRLLQDDRFRGLFCIWGGYGSMTLLDHIDYELWRERRPVFVGYSDITALHLAIEKRVGLVTYHGPGFFSPTRPTTEEAKTDLIRNVTHIGERHVLSNHNKEPFGVLREGNCRGTLTGGNLTLLSRLMGTPYEIETEGKILFFEEIGERPYRLHGMLTQLKLAGKLDACAGILVGSLNGCDEKQRPGSALEAVRDVLKDVEAPTLFNVRAGHIGDALTLPLHAPVQIEGDQVICFP